MSRTQETEDPERVLAATVDAAAAAFGSRLLAAYAIGSLAHGGFAPRVSDVDAAIVIDDPLTGPDAEVIGALVDRIRSGGGLAARLSLFWASPATLTNGVGGGRLPALDRLDWARHGRLLRGGFDLASIARPSTRQLVVEAVEFALDRLATDAVTAELHDPAALVAQGARPVTKRVLFPVRFLFTAATGDIGTNEAAVDWFLATPHPAHTLVAHAARWRTEPVDAPSAQRLLRDEVVPLYDAFLAVHVELMEREGEPALARRLREWGARLDQSR